MTGASVSWASSSAAVATVSAAGLVMAAGNGTATTWGHRFTDGDGAGFGELLDPEVYTDVMGEDTCPERKLGRPAWLSDHYFTKTLDYRLNLASTQARFASVRRPRRLCCREAASKKGPAPGARIRA